MFAHGKSKIESAVASFRKASDTLMQGIGECETEREGIRKQQGDLLAEEGKLSDAIRKARSICGNLEKFLL